MPDTISNQVFVVKVRQKKHDRTIYENHWVMPRIEGAEASQLDAGPCKYDREG